MPFARVALATGLAAMGLAACGTQTAPPAGRGKIDNPRTAYSNKINCLRGQKLAATPITVNRLAGIQVGAPPSGPVIAFQSTPGIAQGLQITGQAQSAEVIGSALLYPNQAGEKLLSKVESCLARGVTG